MQFSAWPLLLYIFILWLSVEELECFIVVFGVVDEAVVGEDYALDSAVFGAECVDVAFRPFSAGGFRELSLIVAEVVPADAFAGAVLFKLIAAVSGPAGLRGFLFRDVV